MAKAEKLCSWDCEPAEGHTLFTQGNVNEVLPGVTRPLVADLAAWWDFYWVDGVTRDLGVHELVDIQAPPHFNQLGFLGGRWALNVSLSIEITSTWAAAEGGAMLTSFFEGGEQISVDGAKAQTRAVSAHAQILDRWRKAAWWRKREERISRAAYLATRKRDLTKLTDRQVVDLVEENTRRLGKTFETHYYVTVGGGELASQLGRLLEQYVRHPKPEWVTMLTSGLGEVESTRPGKAIWDLSRLIAGRKRLAAEFAAMTADQAVARLAAPPNSDWEAFAVAYRAFIDEYGWRGQREVDPSVPTWDEAPGFVIGAIQADLQAPDSANPHRRERRAMQARERLEQRILPQIPRQYRDDFLRHLRLTQLLSREREAVKAAWARESRIFRPLCLEMGRRLTREGILETFEDVWFLRWEELQAAGRGERTVDIAQSVASRKAEYERLQAYTTPDGVFTWPADLVALGGADDEDQRELRALGVSPGIAEGRARVILDVYDDAEIEPGEVLVAQVTDAPWTPLFVPAVAVVVEMGGVLSHAATVAREFGIPGVSGVKDATRIIKTGQLVRVDGNTGTVTILSD